MRSSVKRRVQPRDDIMQPPVIEVILEMIREKRIESRVDVFSLMIVLDG